MNTDPNRKRSRVACTSCQSRKRKCSGGQPCTICAQCGTECHYDYFSRKKKDVKPSPYAGNILQPAATTTGNSSDLTNSTGPGVDERARSSPIEPDHIPPNSLQVNSGAAFVRRLGLRIDGAHATRLHLFAWNIGVRAPALPPPRAAPIVDIITQEEMRQAIAVWFDKIDPSYGFIDRDYLLRQVSRRWLPPSSESALHYGLYDSVLCGIAAMGFLYSKYKASMAEANLVETARVLVEQHVVSEPPSIDLVTGWVLRVSYMRMTASPHATWLTSCTLMHLIEAAGLHIELPDSSLKANDDNRNVASADLRRRLFWMGRHLNIWVSFELGRSRVVLHGANSLPPERRLDVSPTEVFELLPTSEGLDPAKSQDSRDLEAALSDVLDGVHAQRVLILGQCQLALCIFRRLRALNSTISPKLLDRTVALAATALRAARELNASFSPWHHIANVPFQIVCTLLAMDNQRSLALLGDAMQTMHEIATQYDTDIMREAYSTAYLLILLHQRRKEDDTRTISDVLKVNSVASFLPSYQDSHPSPQHGGRLGAGGPAAPTAPAVTNTAAAEAAAAANHGLPHEIPPSYGPPIPTNASASLLAPNNITNHSPSHSVPSQQQPLPQPPPPPPNLSEFSWLGDLMIDMPSLQNFDLDQFLTTDVPWPLPEMGI